MQTDITSIFSTNKLIKALCEKAAYPHDADQIKLIETHISWVLLTGNYAYKIKKPVNFGFLDFSTLEKRKFCCQEEVRLNSRLAKAWYLAVVPITGSFDCPKIGGIGEPIEYAVKMVQFPSVQTLGQSAENGNLTCVDIDQISRIVADFHQSIDKADADSPYGESRDIKRWFDENFVHIKPLLNDEQAIERLNVIESWSEAEWVAKLPLMQQRKQSGFIRECHGDLHLGNMTQIDGEIILFDCIEFNPMLCWIDVISEIAFVIMDLMHLGYEDFAYRFLNQYLQHTGDYEGVGLLRYYVVYRALVRAKVALLRKSQESYALLAEKAHSEYRQFANLAEVFIKDKPLMLIITHGFSGSGKSTCASLLAEKIGAIQIRSDVERKRLFGYSAQTSTENDVGSGVYSSDAGSRTYKRLVELAESILNSGYSVIIDAAFLKAEQRQLFMQLAIAKKVKFTIIDFQVPVETLYKRIEQRRNDPSEATIDVLKQQIKSAESLSKVEMNNAILVNNENCNNIDELVDRLYSNRLFNLGQ